MRCTHPKKSLGGFDRFFFVHPKDISVHLFLDSQAEWNAVRFPIWGLLLGTYINDPFLSFFFKNYKTHIIRQRQRKSVLWLCGLLSSLTLIRASFWYKQMFQDFSPAPLYAGGAWMWLPKWSFEGHSNVLYTPTMLLMSCRAFGLVFKAWSPPSWHRNTDIWRYCSIFFIIPVTWMNLPDEKESNRG